MSTQNTKALSFEGKERAKTAFNNKGYSTRSLAKAASPEEFDADTTPISHGTVQNFLKGKPIKADAFNAICECLDLDPEDVCEKFTHQLYKLLNGEQLQGWYDYPLASCRNSEKKYYKLIHTPTFIPPINIITAIEEYEEKDDLVTLVFTTTNHELTLPNGMEFKFLDRNSRIHISEICKSERTQVCFKEIPWRIGKFGIKIVYPRFKRTDWFETRSL